MTAADAAFEIPRVQGLRQHPFRVTGRLFWVSGELIRAALDFLVRCAFRPESSRALWQQRAARRHLRIFRFEAEVSGAIPAHGLLVSNHLSYLDILVLAAITPAMFVAKREVRSWPVLGWFTQLAGTLFIDRERRMHVGPVNAEIQTALEHGALVVLFPEGTSSDGRTVLPFRSSLLEPATLPAHPLHVSCIEYVIADGDAQREVCYWGDHTFFPHLLNLLAKRAIRARVRFAQVQNRSPDRKELALQLHAEVLKLKETAENGAHSRI